MLNNEAAWNYAAQVLGALGYSWAWERPLCFSKGGTGSRECRGVWRQEGGQASEYGNGINIPTPKGRLQCVNPRQPGPCLGKRRPSKKGGNYLSGKIAPLLFYCSLVVSASLFLLLLFFLFDVVSSLEKDFDGGSGEGGFCPPARGACVCGGTLG